MGLWHMAEPLRGISQEQQRALQAMLTSMSSLWSALSLWPLTMLRLLPTRAEQVAANMLNRHGLAVIWELHQSAAKADREGDTKSARSMILIADAAEREWLRRLSRKADGANS
jgi:hypothetical protein